MTTLFRGGHVVTMDAEGSELSGGWILAEDGLVSDVGGGAAPEADAVVDLDGCLVTPGLVNTHHHLYQTLTRTRAQQADLFTWLRPSTRSGAGSTRNPSTPPRERASRSSRSLAARPSSTTTTSSRPAAQASSKPRSRRQELGLRLVASRGSMDLGESDGGLPPDSLVEETDAVLAETERVAGALHETGPGARIQIAVAPCSPFSVTTGLMRESAELARRLGLLLHTHLAETVEEEVLPGAVRLPPRRVPGRARLARPGRLVRPLRPPLGRGHRAVRGDGDGCRPLPHLESPARSGRRAASRAPRCGCTRRTRRRRVRLERARRPLGGGEAGASVRPRPRGRHGAHRPRSPPAPERAAARRSFGARI